LTKLSIIIVNWMSEAHLRECLLSVFAGTAGLTCEVIVVDNASPTEGLSAVEAAFPSARFIRSNDNVGFGRANNLGYDHSSGELLLFLNPDTCVIGEAVPEMVRTLEALPAAGILGCRLLNTDYSLQISAIQPFPTILNQALGLEWLQRKVPDCRLWRLGALFSVEGTAVRVEGVSGACLLIRRSVFAQIGMFSPEYFMYAEDIDLCYKAGLVGWQTWFTPAAVVLHHGGGSSRQRQVSGWSAVVQQQAKYIFLQKFRGRAYARAFKVAMGAVAAARVIVLAMLGISAAGRSGRASGLRSASGKWAAILRWSVGSAGNCGSGGPPTANVRVSASHSS
jgi:N-acetylglucosaminyl-diphospho-decaprenol L-rhamnosyltransferase